MISLIQKIFQPDIPSQNLELMLSTKPSGMRHLLRGESAGGTAPDHENYLCVTANFYFNPQQGKIITFYNHDPNQQNPQGSFLIAVLDYETHMRTKAFNMFFKIVNTYLSSCAPVARENIKKSVELYNEKSKIPA